MSLDLSNYDVKAKEAVKVFWGNRAAAAAKQRELDREDQGERSGVTGWTCSLSIRSDWLRRSN